MEEVKDPGLRGGASERVRATGAAPGEAPRAIVDFSATLRRAAISALSHDFLTVAQATAYSGMVALFPALIVAAAIVG